MKLSPNLYNYERRTPLHLAARFGNIEICEYLVAKGADINAHDNFGFTPLDEAKRIQDESIIKYTPSTLIKLTK